MPLTTEQKLINKIDRCQSLVESHGRSWIGHHVTQHTPLKRVLLKRALRNIQRAEQRLARLKAKLAEERTMLLPI